MRRCPEILRPSRRAVLGGAAAALVLPRLALAAPFVLRAEPVTVRLLEDALPPTDMLGLNGMTPGPELRYRQGDRLDVRFENRIGAPSSLHWHGIRLENAMDGVPGMTQPPVPDGGSFDYAFTLPDAGTYWYHSHSRSWEQVVRGLFGPLLVEEREPPAVDHDVTVIIDDWRLTETGALADGFGNRHDRAHGGRLGNWASATASVGTVRRGDRLRLRFLNVATARVFPLRLTGATGRVVALDGMPLPAPRPLTDLHIAPAQRVDMIVDVTGEAGITRDEVQFQFPTEDAPFVMGQIAIHGDNPAPIGGAIPALPAARIQPPGDPGAVVTLTMQGGAMGNRHGGDDIWAFNDHSNLPETPFFQVFAGETRRIRLVNDTVWPHGMHLHGHHFHELAADGTLGDLRDTTLLQRGETRDILCVFDNPGKWLLHCHMLDHQAAGMKTWVEVL